MIVFFIVLKLEVIYLYYMLYFLDRIIIDGVFLVSYIMILEYLWFGCSYIFIEDVCWRLIGLFGCILIGNKIIVFVRVKFEEDVCWGF